MHSLTRRPGITIYCLGVIYRYFFAKWKWKVVQKRNYRKDESAGYKCVTHPSLSNSLFVWRRQPPVGIPNLLQHRSHRKWRSLRSAFGERWCAVMRGRRRCAWFRLVTPNSTVGTPRSCVGWRQNHTLVISHIIRLDMKSYASNCAVILTTHVFVWQDNGVVIRRTVPHTTQSKRRCNFIRCHFFLSASFLSCHCSVVGRHICHGRTAQVPVCGERGWTVGAVSSERNRSSKLS